MKDNNALIKIDELENTNTSNTEEEIIIEDLTDEIEIEDTYDYNDTTEEDEEETDEVEKTKPVKKERKDTPFYTTQSKIKERLNEKIYPKNKLIKKITNLETYEKIYDGVENTIKVVSNITSKNIKICTKFTKKNAKLLAIRHQNMNTDFKRNIDGEIRVKVKSINSPRGNKKVVDIYITKYWSEKCIRNLDYSKATSLIEKIQLNKDQSYFLIKIRSENKVKEIKIEKWAYEDMIVQLNNVF